MKPIDIIGKRITDVKDKIDNYDSSNELLTSSGIVELESGATFEIPYRDSESLSLVNNGEKGYNSIFNEENFFKRLFSNAKYRREIADRNKRQMKGKLIVAIYQFNEADDDDDWNELEERMIIELESGYLISEVGMSPFGTGAAGLCVFKSKRELENKYGQKLMKVY